LATGYTIKALARNPAKQTIHHEGLTWLPGDVTEPAKVSEVIAESQAVLNVIGQVPGSPKDLQTVAIQNILDGMKLHNVQRLITLTGAGVRDPNDQPKPVDHIFGFLLKLFSPQVIADSVQCINLVRASDRDWVVVRVPRLIDGPLTNHYKVGYVGPDSGIQIARADVAHFMLRQLESDTHLRQMPVISY
jgi:putative NADH-flavin reductase